MRVIFVFAFLLLKVSSNLGVKLDLINCGVDPEVDVLTGNVEITVYPWLGILYYTNYGESGELRSVTTVALIQEEFVIAPAADIGPMPKHNFRKYSRVLLGESWVYDGRRVASYVLHPEYGETYNTVALVQLRDPIRTTPDQKFIRPLCPPPDLLRNPDFYVVKFKEDYNTLRKEVIPVIHIPGNLCKEFYIAANLYAKKMRPPHVACAISKEESKPCVWEAGGALVSKDAWGRWMLLGLGVRGPGCGAPARFLDMMSYYPWIEQSLEKFSRITISRINKQKYVLRSSNDSNKSTQRFGACDPEEQLNLIYRECIILKSDNKLYQFLTYNMTIRDSVEYTCLTLEMVNATGVSEMRVKHFCPREAYGPPCHYYRFTTFDITVFMMFSENVRFDMFAWGIHKKLTLLDVQEWKWEEGTYYEDFSMTRSEYKGTADITNLGFEPIDDALWVPEYDIWTTTEFDNSSTTMGRPYFNFWNSDEDGKDDKTYYGNETVSEFLWGIRWKRK